MALPSRIELCSGVSQRLRLGLRLVWFTALINLALQAERAPLSLLLISGLLLLWSWPGNLSAGAQTRRLVLHVNGLAQWGDEPGEWQRNTWRTRWYTVIRFKSAQRNEWLWISAHQNHAETYRRLGIWCHFSPRPPAAGVNDSH